MSGGQSVGDLVALEQFLRLADYSQGRDACWPWVGLRNNDYGQFKTAGRYHTATRWLLGELRGKPLVWPDEHACHHCDNPPCVNPRHLYVGSYATNIKDRVDRGRGRSGIRNSAKTHCPYGHPYDERNTFVSKKGERNCRACRNEYARKWRIRQKTGK